MITASFIVSTLVGLVGGATVGAGVTGWFTIKQKAKKRVQKRRELVYIDMLAWIYTRIPAVRSAKANTADTPSNGKLANPSPSAIAPDRKSTFPDSMALDPGEDADPGKPYFVTLRARVVAFGSHDMLRAFDKWTKLYKNILDDPVSAKEFWFKKITYADAIIPPGPPSDAENPLSTSPNAFARFMKRWTDRRQAKREFKELNGRSRGRDAGLPDPVKGGLTIAIERCASKELRKG